MNDGRDFFSILRIKSSSDSENKIWQISSLESFRQGLEMIDELIEYSQQANRSGSFFGKIEGFGKRHFDEKNSQKPMFRFKVEINPDFFDASLLQRMFWSEVTIEGIIDRFQIFDFSPIKSFKLAVSFASSALYDCEQCSQ